MTTFAHIVKIIAAPPDSEWGIAQPITFASMRSARSFAPDLSIDLCAVTLAGEEAATPEGFRRISPLPRDVSGVATFAHRRPLPLLRDVLDRLHQESDAEYLIYTNVDIALMPQFYAAVHALIKQGHDAIVINRRTIPDHFRSADELPLMYATIGKPHPGFDCFVFKRSLYPQFILNDVCLGVGHVDLPLICGMIAAASSFILLKDEHLTFHIGDPRTWKRPDMREYRAHNDRHAAQALATLASRSSRSMRPWLRALLKIPLLKNSLFVAEFRRLFSR